MIFLLIIPLFALYIYFFLQQKKFGSLPKDGRLQRVLASPNYRDGQFQNESFTPNLAEGVTYGGIIKDLLFKKNKNRKPASKIPAVKTDIKAIPITEDVIIWFGHSSYFLQTDGKKFLVDPVFSGNASPLSFTTKSFAGTDIYGADDLPFIDYLIISHDHWDHLDYKTIMALRSKVNAIVCSLGTGAHFERWGFDMSKIIEKDWNEHFILEPGFEINTVAARHFAGRTFKRNKALWMSYALRTPTKNIFIGGDSGYDAHFKKAGDALGPFDLAILECGQYDKNWKYIHMMPEQTLQAAKDLKATKLLPVHWGKFQLANHDWDAPVKTLFENNLQNEMPLLTPMIGEVIYLNKQQYFEKWWEAVK